MNMYPVCWAAVLSWLLSHIFLLKVDIYIIYSTLCYVVAASYMTFAQWKHHPACLACCVHFVMVHGCSLLPFPVEKATNIVWVVMLMLCRITMLCFWPAHLKVDVWGLMYATVLLHDGHHKVRQALLNLHGHWFRRILENVSHFMSNGDCWVVGGGGMWEWGDVEVQYLLFYVHRQYHVYITGSELWLTVEQLQQPYNTSKQWSGRMQLE